MATEDQKVSIDFGQGVDQKSDFAQVIGTKLSSLVNRVFTKAKQLKKDFGFSQKPTIQVDGLDLTSSQKIFNFKNSLNVMDFNQAKSFSESSEVWSTRGGPLQQISPVFNATDSVIKTNSSLSGIVMARIGNVECWAYNDDEGTLKVLIVDGETQSIIVSEQTISTSSPGAQVIPYGLANNVWIIYSEGAVLKYRSVDLSSTTPTISAATTLFSDLGFLFASSYSLRWDLDYSSSILGIVYHNSSFNIAMRTFNTSGIQIDSNSSIDSPPAINGLGIKYNSTTEKFWLAYDDATDLITVILNKNLTSFLGRTVAAIDVTLEPYAGLGASVPIVGGFDGPEISSDISWFYVTESKYLYRVTVSDNGIFKQNNFIGSDLWLASKTFRVGSELYISTVYIDAFQGALFVMDSNGSIVSKSFIDRQAHPLRDLKTNLAFVSNTDFIYYIPSADRSDLLLETEGLTAQGLENPVNKSIYGASRLTVGFNNVYPIRPQALSLANATYLTGPVTKTFDGNSLVEAGFHAFPKLNEWSISTDNAIILSPFVVSVIQQGTAGLPEIYTIECCAGSFIGSGQYFTFSTTTINHYVWFRRNGAGTDPNPPALIERQVEIESSFSAIDVASAIAYVLEVTSPINATISRVNNIITITNSANGIVTDATNVNVGLGRIAIGDYQYSCCYEWTDFEGRVHRSAPSFPISFEALIGTLSNRWIPLSFTITDKTSVYGVKDINLVLYRTLAGPGLVYYRVTPNAEPVYNKTDVNNGLDALYFLYDNQSDAEIQDNETLYTTGGILENSSFPPTRQLRLIGNRVFGIDSDKNELFFSKLINNDLEVATTDQFTISIGESNSKLVDVFEMDEKVIVFKEDKPFYFVGDGPNNLGQGSSFSDPESINCPVGGRDTGSAIEIPSGVMYSTPKGIYLLSRALESSFIGNPVEDTKTNIVYASVRTPDLAQVRFLLDNGTFLIYDYDFDQWSTRTFTTADITPIDALVYNNKITIAAGSDGVWEQTSLFRDNFDFTTSLETGWINVSGIQGYQRVKRAIILGQYKSEHTLTVRVGYDYNEDYSEIYSFTPAPENPLQFEFQIANQKCSSIRFKIVDSAVSGNLLEGNTLTNLTLIVGVKKGISKLPYTKRA